MPPGPSSPSVTPPTPTGRRRQLSPSTSRDPSPSSAVGLPPFSASPALVQAGLGLGLLSVPPSPGLPSGDWGATGASLSSSEGSSSETKAPRPVASTSTRKFSGPRNFLRKARSFSSGSAAASSSSVGPAPAPPVPPAFLPPSPPLPSPPLLRHSPPVKQRVLTSVSGAPTERSASPEQEALDPGDNDMGGLRGSAPHFPLHPVLPMAPMPRKSEESKPRRRETDLPVEREDQRKRKGSTMSRRSTFSFFKRNDAPPLPISHPPLPLAVLPIPATEPTRSRSSSFDSTHASEQPPPRPPEADGIPSLPSLQFSPYRMSWAFGSTSPAASSVGNGASNGIGKGTNGSKSLSRRLSLGGASTPTAEETHLDPFRAVMRRRSQSNSTVGSSRGISRPPSPLKQPTTALSTSPEDTKPLSADWTARRRPTTASSESSSRGGVIGAVTGFFGSGSHSMSRSSSSSSLAVQVGADDSTSAPSEFGALFGGGSSAAKRKRGLSVGASLFGTSDTRKRAGSNSSLSNSWIPPSAVAANGSGGLLVPNSEVLATSPSTTSAPIRSRASTDARRFSFSSNNSSQSASFPTVTRPLPSPGSHNLPSPPSSPPLTRHPSQVQVGVRSESPTNGRKASLSVGERPKRSRTASVTAGLPIMEDETPEAYVKRLVGAVSKSEISRILASSADAFHSAALTAYLSNFDFSSDPLDIALRKFLMEAALPTETQQIDRVMEAFAIRYNDCNPGLWESSDTPYVLAFSLVMLSTDQFNPSNKNKMSKTDYVKNAKIEGVPTEVLEYFFDQITITPFVFVEEEDSPQRPELLQSTSSSSFFSKSTSQKLDPYHMIAMGLTRDLRVDVEATIPTRSPFSFTGTTSFFNATTLHLAFAHAPILQIGSSTQSRVKPSISTSTDGAPLAPVQSNATYAPPKEKNTVSSLKITKIGVLSRKEDLAEGGKKAASRKWKGWSVVLTGSQLLFFKETTIASSLQQSLAAAIAARGATEESQTVVFSSTMPFKPDAVLSLSSSAALYDSAYHRHSHVFRLVAPAGRQYLFQARDADDLNSWLAHINYAASFKTAGLRIRSATPRRSSGTPTPIGHGHPPSLGIGAPVSRSPSWKGAAGLSGSSKSSAANGSQEPPVAPASASTSTEDPQFLLSSVSEEETTLPPGLLDALQLATSFDETTPLARLTEHSTADYGFPLVPPPAVDTRGSASPASDHYTFDRAPITRAEFLREKIAQLEYEIDGARTKLHADLRLARNLAVLTPFRAATRERIVLAVRPIEERVRHTRMNLAKLVCHREVLARDLLAEDRESQRARKTSHTRVSSTSRHPSINRPNSPRIPPRSASQTPASPKASNGTSISPPPLGPRSVSAEAAVAQETLGPSAEDDANEDSDTLGHALTDDELDRLRSPPLMQRSHTEMTGGRLRAASSATSDDDLELQGSLRPNISFMSLQRLRSPSGGSLAPSSSQDNLGPAPVLSSPAGKEPEEVAEDWTKTRAAKRVSIVDYDKFDERGLSSLMRIREERRSEHWGSSEG